jgi:hypothetical protein
MGVRNEEIIETIRLAFLVASTPGIGIRMLLTFPALTLSAS